jgi:cysteine synthase A
MTEITRTLQALSRLVGHTPLLALDVRFRGAVRRIYAKAENFNFTGSIKDRMALHILRKAHEAGVLKPGAPLAEATSGNTGISFAALGCALGHPVTIFMPDWMSQERKDLIRAFGAQIRLVSAAEGGFLGSIRLSEVWAAETPDAFLPCQFANEANVEAHATSTGPEIWAQLASEGLKPDAFVAGVGTGGTVMGVGRFLKDMDSGIQIHPVEPANSPTLHTGHKVGKHRIQGISDEFIPAIVKLDQLDGILAVDDGDAILMAQKLAARGLGVGISSGANFLAALMVQEQLGKEAVVVTVFSDSNKKYLSTALTQEEPAKAGFLSPQVELLGLGQSIRVCEVCLRGDPAAHSCGC